MAELKPVPGQILLTEDEFENLISEVLRYVPKVEGDHTGQRRVRGEQVVRAAMAELNARRFGNPAGVLRRSLAGSLAVRVQDSEGALSWEIPHLDPADESAAGITSEDIRQWAIKHDESWWGRLTVADYEAHRTDS
ncbi:MAG: hypothetical protein K2Y33_03245 [Mycolicibacterium frederiksbergense]|nr:hypothetical protein [Mycolicibacterium frederiksbergense]